MTPSLEVPQPAVAAFGPRSLLATGTVAGSVDSSFSQTSSLEVNLQISYCIMLRDARLHASG